MFYLEDEKTLVLTNENKKDILNALTKINQVSNNKIKELLNKHMLGSSSFYQLNLYTILFILIKIK